MQISRRALLSALPAAGLPALAGAPRARAASARPAADSAADHARLMSNTVAVFAGTAESNARPEAAAKLSAIARAARSHLAAMDAAGTGELFRGLPLGTSDTNLTTSFQYLYETALATRAPGDATADLRGDPALPRRIADALALLYDGTYGDQSKGYYGNWFNWEIAISSHVSRTLVLLAGTLAGYRPDLTAAYVAAMDGYLRNGTDGDVNLDSRFHTGANLADITANRILQGAVLGDDARVAKAVADQLTVCATVDPYHPRHGVTDGFYADGSFVQHASVAYTGTYGTGLLTRLVQTVKTLAGTSYARGGGPAGVVQGWIRDSFAPVVFEGWMMETVKGRAVSRPTTGYADAAAVVEAAVDLSDHATDADWARLLRGWAKFTAGAAPTPPDPAAFVSPVTAVRFADIMADPATPARDLNPPASHSVFAAMDRTVHRRPGFAFALARSSTRISEYEYMNGENLLPWFQGQGAHHLYLSGQDQTRAFGVDHLTAVSPYALAGVTAPVETRLSVPQLYGTAWYDNPALGFTSSSQSQNTYVYFPRATNDFSGGAALGAYGVAGFVQSVDAAWAAEQAGLLPGDFVAYRNADATKSWFFLDDEIAVLAAGVGDGAGRPVTTTLDTRVADPAASLALDGELRDGTAWSGPGTAPLSWLRYADPAQCTAIGYVLLDLPDGQRPTVTLDTVVRSRRTVRTANPDTPVTKLVFALSVGRPAGAPHTSMAYAIVPGATAARLRGYARGPLAVVANTTRLQALAHRGLRLLAANAFAPGTHRAERLVLDGPASVILREEGDGTTSLAVADPTTRRDTVTVVVRGRALGAVRADPGVEVRRVPGGTRLDVATRQSYGRSFEAVLR
ncbi:polysaccharide lyase family 8 super-sandwich domain-containing protein [Streptomyces sp. HPF1205]|uniref:polysaccharide lyase family 8 super-sandwich domain-containing protein n=1 Tax=Streptomyces sp. HPF1205 TaxID=2873262 RepID=UPI001CEC1602|nr:polysaccharide lyase family 8 super-sandwich domain-containing protein [Streptomyces sp. HPF1205]